MDRLRDDKSYTVACTCARTRREVIEVPTSCSASSENTTCLCEKVRDKREEGRQTDRQTEMTSRHGFFLHVQGVVGYSCRAASDGCTVAESAP